MDNSTKFCGALCSKNTSSSQSRNSCSESSINYDLLKVQEGFTLDAAISEFSNPKKRNAGYSVFLYKEVIEPPNVNFETLLNKQQIYVEQLKMCDENGIFEKESAVVKKTKEMKNCKMNMLQKPPVNSESSLLEFWNGFLKHATEKDFYARDITNNTISLPSYLKNVRSHINNREEVSGVNTPMFYIGSTYSNTSLHDEDSNLSSLNLLHAGEPKVWLVVDHTLCATLVQKFYEYCKGNDAIMCPQILTHKYFMLTPAFLDQLGINYVIFEQKQGDLVYVKGGAYHCVINRGLNVAESVNFGDDEWNSQGGVAMPPCTCKDGRNMYIERDRSSFSVSVPSKSRWFLCSEKNCIKRFKKQSTLLIHLKNDHQKEPIVCEICKKILSSISHLNRHARIHDSSKYQTCKICKKMVTDMKQHLLVHNKDENPACPKCKKTMYRRNLSNHIQKCKVECHICNKICSSSRSLTQHLKACAKKRGMQS